MLLKTKSGRVVQMPTPEEEAAINAGMASDPDSRELDAEWFAKAQPASEVLPPDVYAALRHYITEHPIQR